MDSRVISEGETLSSLALGVRVGSFDKFEVFNTPTKILTVA